jgi:hypothetical protein
MCSMPDAPIARVKISETTPFAVPLSPLNVQALIAHRAFMAMAAAYVHALDKFVFIHPISEDYCRLSKHSRFHSSFGRNRRL